MKNRKNYIKSRMKLRRIIDEECIRLGRKCEVCGSNLYDMLKYDSICCLKCNTWLEEACEDVSCIFCKDRPQLPRDVVFSSTSIVYHALGRKRHLQDNYSHKTNGADKHELKRLLYDKSDIKSK